MTINFNFQYGNINFLAIEKYYFEYFCTQVLSRNILHFSLQIKIYNYLIYLDVHLSKKIIRQEIA